MTTKPMWPAAELRLTRCQAEFLAHGTSPSWSTKLANLTEDSLSRRRMISWYVTPTGHGVLRANAKGRKALQKYYERVAANDNRKEGANAA